VLQKGPRHWLRQAIDLVADHPEVVGLGRHALKQRKLGKRLLWACLIRRSFLGLALRSAVPTSIDNLAAVSALTEEDFEMVNVGGHLKQRLPGCGLITDVEGQRQLASICVQLTKLSLIIGHMVQELRPFPPKLKGGPHRAETAMTTAGENARGMGADKIANLHAAFTTWKDKLPPSCWTQPSRLNGSMDKTIYVQQSVLDVLFQAGLATLHGTNSKYPLDPQDLTFESAHGIAVVAGGLRRNGLDKYLPPIGGLTFLPAMAVFTESGKHSLDEVTRKAVAAAAEDCHQVLKGLCERYASEAEALSGAAAKPPWGSPQGSTFHGQGAHTGPRGPLERPHLLPEVGELDSALADIGPLNPGPFNAVEGLNMAAAPPFSTVKPAQVFLYSLPPEGPNPHVTVQSPLSRASSIYTFDFVSLGDPKTPIDWDSGF